MLLAQVWHFWIAVALVIPALLLVVVVVASYVTKVSKPRYPAN